MLANKYFTYESPIQYAYKNGSRDLKINCCKINERPNYLLIYQSLINNFVPESIKKFVNFDQSLLLLENEHQPRNELKELLSKSIHSSLQDVFLEVSQNISYSFANEKQLVVFGKTISSIWKNKI